MASTINNNLVFIDSMEFMNSSLNPLVKNLSNKDFDIYILQKFSGDLLELVKQQRMYPYQGLIYSSVELRQIKRNLRRHHGRHKGTKLSKLLTTLDMLFQLFI